MSQKNQPPADTSQLWKLTARLFASTLVFAFVYMLGPRFTHDYFLSYVLALVLSLLVFIEVKP